MGTVVIYLQVFFVGLPSWSLWIAAYLFGSFYAFFLGAIAPRPEGALQHHRLLAMNLRHAAALALVGWYLMVPGDVGNLVYGGPSDSMVMVSAFDTAKECEAAVQQEQDIAQRYFHQHHEHDHIPIRNLQGDAAFQASRMGATCIATDDPRLKGN
jgi:hypothetical protein